MNQWEEVSKMITLSTILTILAIILVLWILYKIYESAKPAIQKIIQPPWDSVIFWVLVLILVVVVILPLLGISQPIVK